MSREITVKVSSRNQIALPSAARKELSIHPGDRLLVDIQDGMLILMPEPENYANHMAGLGSEAWVEMDTERYLEEERAAWVQPATTPSPD